jgi:hypothetical protein
MPDDQKEIYLGDGCYASFDGFQIWLRAPRAEGDHLVALEYTAFDRLMTYGQSIWRPSSE